MKAGQSAGGGIGEPICDFIPDERLGRFADRFMSDRPSGTKLIGAAGLIEQPFHRVRKTFSLVWHLGVIPRAEEVIDRGLLFQSTLDDLQSPVTCF